MKVAVLYGGTSAERDISVVSGVAIGRALLERGHEVSMVDPAKGPYALSPDEVAHSAVITNEPPAIRGERGKALEAISGAAVQRAEVVFLALHGGTGEDGTIQGIMELAGKRYTGSGILASAMAMNKRVSKVLFERGGIATPAWGMVTGHGASPAPGGHTAPSFESDFARERAADLVADLGGFPVVVKPSDQGSTVGLTVVNKERHLSAAIDDAARFSHDVLVERYIPGREVTVSVLGEDPLPVVEIVPRKGIYDYESKYTKGMSEYHCPSDLPGSVADELAQLAVRAFAALGCRGYARADFRLTADYQPYCLEVNTLPGMTDVSLVPMAAAAVGISFLDLIERITRSALE